MKCLVAREGECLWRIYRVWFMICSLRYSVVVSHSVVCTRVYIYIYISYVHTWVPERHDAYKVGWPWTYGHGMDEYLSTDKFVMPQFLCYDMVYGMGYVWVLNYVPHRCIHRDVDIIRYRNVGAKMLLRRESKRWRHNNGDVYRRSKGVSGTSGLSTLWVRYGVWKWVWWTGMNMNKKLER